jgi:hypothetical protein
MKKWREVLADLDFSGSGGGGINLKFISLSSKRDLSFFSYLLAKPQPR